MVPYHVLSCQLSALLPPFVRGCCREIIAESYGIVIELPSVRSLPRRLLKPLRWQGWSGPTACDLVDVRYAPTNEDTFG